jgi:hypothetical protein
MHAPMNRPLSDGASRGAPTRLPTRASTLQPRDRTDVPTTQQQALRRNVPPASEEPEVPRPAVLTLGLTVPFALFADIRRRSHASYGLVSHIESLVATDLIQHLGGSVSTVVVGAGCARRVGATGDGEEPLLLTLTFVNTAALGHEQRASFVRALRSVVLTRDAFRGLRRNLQYLLSVAEPIALILDLCRVDGNPVQDERVFAPPASAAVPLSGANSGISIFSVLHDTQPVEVVDIFLPLPPPASRRLDLSGAQQWPYARPADEAPGVDEAKLPQPKSAVDNSFGFLCMDTRSPSPVMRSPGVPAFSSVTGARDQQLPTFLGATVVADAGSQGPSGSSNLHVRHPVAEVSTQTDAPPVSVTVAAQTEVSFVIPEQIVTEERRRGDRDIDLDMAVGGSVKVIQDLTQSDTVPGERTAPSAADGVRNSTMATAEQAMAALLPSRSNSLRRDADDDGDEVLVPRNAGCPNPSPYPARAAEPLTETNSAGTSRTTTLEPTSDDEAAPTSAGYSSRSAVAPQQEEELSPPGSPGCCYTKATFDLLLETRDALLQAVQMMDVLRDEVRLDVLNALRSQDVRLSDIVVSHKFPDQDHRANTGSKHVIHFFISVRAANRLKLVIPHVLSGYLRLPAALKGLSELISSSTAIPCRWSAVAVNGLPVSATSLSEVRVDKRRKAYIVQGRKSQEAIRGPSSKSSATAALGPLDRVLSGVRPATDPQRAHSPQPTPPPSIRAAPPPFVETAPCEGPNSKEMRTVKASVAFGPQITFRALKDAIKLSRQHTSVAAGIGEELLRCVHFDLVEQLSAMCGEEDYIRVQYVVPPAGSSSKVPVRFEASLAVQSSAAAPAAKLLAQYLVSPNALQCAVEYFCSRVSTATPVIAVNPRVDVHGTFINDEPLRSFQL